MFGNNPFIKKDPLVEAVIQARKDGDMRRQAEALVNEEFGVYSRKAVVREHLAAYDAAIEEAYKCMKEGKPLADKDYDKDGKIESPKDEVWGSRLRAAKMAGKLKEADMGVGAPGSSSGREALKAAGNPPMGTFADPKGGMVAASSIAKSKTSAPVKEGMMDPNDPSVQGSGDVTSSPAKKQSMPRPTAPKTDSSVQGSGDVTKGGKPASVREEKWEGSKKDRDEDKRLAKKHGMTLAQWEKSDADKKHDAKERIDELSKDAIGMYLGQAGYDRERARGEAEVHVDSDKPHEREWAKNQYKKANRRAKGAHLAISKLVGYAKVPAKGRSKLKEEQIDEINQRKATRYAKVIDAFKHGKGHVGGQTRGERDAVISRHLGGDVHKGEIRRAIKRHVKGLDEGYGNVPAVMSHGHDPLSGGRGRPRTQVATKGERKGMVKKSAQDSMKRHIADRLGKHTKANLPEGYDLDEAAYSAKAARAGKDIGKPGKMFKNIASKAGERYGSEERGKKVAGAILKRIRAKHMEEQVGAKAPIIPKSALAPGQSLRDYMNAKQGLHRRGETSTSSTSKSTPPVAPSAKSSPMAPKASASTYDTDTAKNADPGKLDYTKSNVAPSSTEKPTPPKNYGSAATSSMDTTTTGNEQNPNQNDVTWKNTPSSKPAVDVDNKKNKEAGAVNQNVGESLNEGVVTVGSNRYRIV